MKHLLNTLYVTTEDVYLALDGENIVVRREAEEMARFPLHTLENIVCFSYGGASPALMGACAEKAVNLCFMTPRGRFLARTCGEINGNVLLRKRQYRISDDEQESCLIARNFVFGKVYNCRWSIERTTRDYPMRVDVERLKNISAKLHHSLSLIAAADDLSELRGLEGESALFYFGAFDELILNQKDSFFFRERSRRPPLDSLNSILSFVYILLANDCAAALESIGLDSYVGFMHRDRPGRMSLALDLMEELRPVMADRFVLSLINSKIIEPNGFLKQENGAVLIRDDCRKNILNAWQNKKKETLTHPYLNEKITWGLVPYVQALLLSRFLRGDLDAYPPFLWK